MSKLPGLRLYPEGWQPDLTKDEIDEGTSVEDYLKTVRNTPVTPALVERFRGFCDFLKEHSDEWEAGTDWYIAAIGLLRAQQRKMKDATTIAALKEQGIEPFSPGDEDVVESLREAGRQDGVVTLSSVTPERVTWLWKDRIPEHKLCTIQGDPEEGKSTVTLDLAARLSTGRPMPDGGGKREPMDVLVMSAEDGTADTIVPRLMAAGADLHRCHQWKAVPRYSDEGLLVREDGIMLPADLHELEKHITNYSARFVIIDPLNAFVFSGDGNKDTFMRQALTPISAMAEHLNVTIMGVRHLNKSGGTDAKYRGGGTIAVTAAVRSELLCAPDTDEELRARGVRILAVSKGNLAAKPPGLRYWMEESGPYGSIRVVWGEAVAITANQLLAGPRQPSEADKVADFLREMLADGEWHDLKPLQEEADQRGVSTNKTTWGAGRELAHAEYGREGFGTPYRYRLLPSDGANLPTV
jgi:hypothetical protein